MLRLKTVESSHSENAAMITFRVASQVVQCARLRKRLRLAPTKFLIRDTGT